MRSVPFCKWHLNWLDGVEPGPLLATAADEMARGVARTIVNDDGAPVMCGGILQQWPGRHMAWALFDAHADKHVFGIVRIAREFFDEVQGRIEFTVRCDFDAGHRFAKALYFEVETPLLRCYGPEGEDHVGYVRFN